MDFTLYILVRLFYVSYYSRLHSDRADRPRAFSLSLLRTFYAEGLVDSRTFLSWLVQQMCTCNLAQAGFIARLADEYLDGMLVSRALTHPFIEACLNKLIEVRVFVRGYTWIGIHRDADSELFGEGAPRGYGQRHQASSIGMCSICVQDP